MSSRPVETRLERALFELGPRVAFPPEPDLAPRVIAAIAQQGASRTRVAVRAPRRAARAFAFGMAALLAATVTLTLSPATRDAVADFFGIGGVRIETGPGPVPTAAPGENLALGEPTTLDAARARVDFDVFVPTEPGLGEPDEVYLSPVPAGGRVSLVYRADDALPAADETGLGLLVTEFEATIEADLAKKLSLQQRVRPAVVNGTPALWVRGQHTLFYLDADGRQQSETLRLAANALIWMNGETTLRLESALSLEESVRIAESMR